MKPTDQQLRDDGWRQGEVHRSGVYSILYADGSIGMPYLIEGDTPPAAGWWYKIHEPHEPLGAEIVPGRWYWIGVNGRTKRYPAVYLYDTNMRRTMLFWFDPVHKDYRHDSPVDVEVLAPCEMPAGVS